MNSNVHESHIWLEEFVGDSLTGLRSLIEQSIKDAESSAGGPDAEDLDSFYEFYHQQKLLENFLYELATYEEYKPQGYQSASNAHGYGNEHDKSLTAVTHILQSQIDEFGGDALAEFGALAGDAIVAAENSMNNNLLGLIADDLAL